MKKRIFAITMSLVLALSITACGKNDKKNDGDKNLQLKT